jgi:hypothetical protein
MPAQPHSRDAYMYLFHRLYCDGVPMEKAADEVGIHPTIAFKAATGYVQGKDGAIGRACFLSWLKGLRSPQGAPCCRAHVTPGKRLLVSPPALLERQTAIAALERESAEVQRKLAQLRSALGEGRELLEEFEDQRKAPS